MARYQLKPRLDSTNSKWRLSIPATISPTKKRMRQWFESHSQALGAANRIRMAHDQFGLSLRMLPPARLTEAVECFDLLDKATTAGGPVPNGSLRRIVLAAIKAQRERTKSITLDQLWEIYLDRLTRHQRSKSHIAQAGYARQRLRFLADEKLPDIGPKDIEVFLADVSPGNRNSYQSIYRALFNLAVKRGHLKENPVLKLEFARYPKPEIRALSNDVVARMFEHAAAHQPDLLPAYTLGFFCGIREAELYRLVWSDIRMEDGDSYVLIRPAVSKSRRKRVPPLPPNAQEWLRLYLSIRAAASAGGPVPDEPVLARWTSRTMALARQRNYEAAAGRHAKWPLNCKRRTFATAWVAAYEDLDRLALILGHTLVATSFAHYVGGTTRALGLAYFDIRPAA